MSAFNSQNIILQESQDNYEMYKKIINSQGLIGYGPASCMANVCFQTSQRVSLTTCDVVGGGCQKSKPKASYEGDAMPNGSSSSSAVAVTLWSGTIK